MLSVADEVVASDGRDWKYLATGLPLASVKVWPMQRRADDLAVLR